MRGGGRGGGEGGEGGGGGGVKRSHHATGRGGGEADAGRKERGRNQATRDRQKIERIIKNSRAVGAIEGKGGGRERGREGGREEEEGEMTTRPIENERRAKRGETETQNCDNRRLNWIFAR